MADVLKRTLETADFLTGKYETFSPEEEARLLEILDAMKCKIKLKALKVRKITNAKVVSLEKYKKLSGYYSNKTNPKKQRKN